MDMWKFEEALGAAAEKHVKTIDFFLREEPLWKRVMKKAVKYAATAAAAVVTVSVIALFMLLQNRPQSVNALGAGPQQPKSTLRICVDMGDTYPRYAGSTASAMENLVSTLELYFRVEKKVQMGIEVEVIPTSGAARATALASVRTAVMSGEGPDVFIVASPDSSSDTQSLFPYPEKAMAAGYFLPLDSYKKSSQFTDWDKLEPAIMEAGKTEEGQVLIPMAFDLLLTYYHQDEAEGYEASTRWQDMVNGDDPALSGAAAPVRSGDSAHLMSNNWFPVVFGEYVNFSQESLLVTEEELFQTAQTVGELSVAKGTPAHFSSVASKYRFGIDVTPDQMAWMNGVGFKDDLTMVPVYNTTGGATAMVKTYCAVNRNTPQPENAFFAVDYFLSESVQANSSLYSAWNFDHMMSNTEYVKSKMTKAQAQEFSRIMEQITCVRYWTPLDAELANIIDTANVRGWTEEKLRENVSTAYEKMKMLLAES